MRDHAGSTTSVLPTPNSKAAPGGFAVLRSLTPYLWDYRWRVGLALLCLVIAKLANVGVPLVLK